MAKFYPSITEDLAEWMTQQHLFFVATAPLSETGHVNVSPKGLNTFRILAPNRVAYLDLTGSGNETSAHLKENERITFMFCAFEGSPRILRLYGQGRVILPTDDEWETWCEHFTRITGARQIIIAEIDTVQTSCGFAVPLLDFVGERDALIKWAKKKGDEGLDAYWEEKNHKSLDGLPTHLAQADSAP